MKNGKKPTREQRKLLESKGLISDQWLVVKNLKECLEIVGRETGALVRLLK